MNDFMTIIFAQAQPAAPPGNAPGAPAGGLYQMLIPLLFIFAIFYFMMIRPDQRRRKEHQKLIEALKPGDRVVTSGGIFGVVANVKDKTVLVKIADNVKIEMQKGSVQTVLPKSESSPDATPKV